MHRRYQDILSRIAEPPIWYDGHGTPRFEPFHPSSCGVYDDAIAYVEIACQGCGRRFMVAAEADMTNLALRAERGTMYPTTTETGDFHYGDPPSHDCVGESMNCKTIRIHQFWTLDQHMQHGWSRAPEYEIDYGEGDLHDGEEAS